MDQQILQAAYKAYAPHNNNTTMDQQLLWDDLQSICVQQQYTNIVKRGIDMGVNTKKWLTTSSTPLHGSFVYLPTIFP